MTWPSVILSPDFTSISVRFPVAVGVTVTERIASPLPIAFSLSLTTARSAGLTTTRGASAKPLRRPCPRSLSPEPPLAPSPPCGPDKASINGCETPIAAKVSPAPGARRTHAAPPTARTTTLIAS